MIALFVAIGGVSWAATKIGTSDIKNGAVTAKKLHKGAVTKTKLHGNSVKSGKVIDNSLTGADINESTLGTVPNASHANNADNANNANNAVQASNASTLNGADASNLVSGYATIAAGASPTVRNSGGKRVSSVTVSRVGTGNYNVTFHGNFPGVTSINQVATSATMWDTDNFDTASASNDQSSANSSAITVRVFTWQTNTATLTDRDFSVSIMTP